MHLENQDLIIYGAGGHGNVVLDIAEQLRLPILFFMDKGATVQQKFWGYPVIGEAKVGTVASQVNYIVAVGDNANRKNIVNSILTEAIFTSLLHPRTSVSPRAIIGMGTVLTAGSVVNPGAVIGKHCIINTNAAVGHDCQLNDFVNIGPNAALAGQVAVGEGTWVGLGASILQGITIGSWCVIGAGAVVLNDVPDGATVVGNPAKIIGMNALTVVG